MKSSDEANCSCVHFSLHTLMTRWPNTLNFQQHIQNNEYIYNVRPTKNPGRLLSQSNIFYMIIQQHQNVQEWICSTFQHHQILQIYLPPLTVNLKDVEYVLRLNVWLGTLPISTISPMIIHPVRKDLRIKRFKFVRSCEIRS